MRATLTKVLTPAAFQKMVALGTRWSDGVDADNGPALAMYQGLGFN
jgi:ribosomal protein S18 acetylase RimI-like enzyme